MMVVSSHFLEAQSKPCVGCAGQPERNVGQLETANEAEGSHMAGSNARADEDDPELADVLKRSLEEH